MASSSLGWFFRRVVPLIIGLVLLVLVIAYLAGFFTEKVPGGLAEAAPAEQLSLEDYVVCEVAVREKPYIVEAIGTLKAARRTDISARVLAPIERIAVRAGDHVEEGQVLIELDRKALEAQVRQAQAALAAAEADLNRAKDEYDRAVRLREVNPGALADQEFQRITANLRAAEANYAKAQQALQEAEVLLSYTTIRAPRTGTIVDRWAEVGDMARPGVPLLSLYDPTSLRLEVPVMENLAAKIHKGDKLTVYIDALDKEFEGTVDEKVPQAEAATRSFLIKVKLPPSEDLYEGMFGRLLIPAGTRRHLCLHMAALERVGQLEFVHVYDPQTGRTERRLIKTGRRGYGYWVEVLSGLAPGEKVLVSKKKMEELEKTVKPQPQPYPTTCIQSPLSATPETKARKSVEQKTGKPLEDTSKTQGAKESGSAGSQSGAGN